MSDITINSAPFPDGAPLPISDGFETKQAQKVTVNGKTVWVNNTIPSAITDFAASDDQIGQVTMTFTPAIGIPAPTHGLYADGVLVQSDIISGFVLPVTGPDTSDYRVEALNVAGSTPSNTDSGTSLTAALNLSVESKLLRAKTGQAGEVGVGFQGDGGSGVLAAVWSSTPDPVMAPTPATLNTSEDFGSGISTAALGGSFPESFRVEFTSAGMRIGVLASNDEWAAWSAVLNYTHGVGFDNAIVTTGDLNIHNYVELEGSGFAVRLRFRFSTGAVGVWSDWLNFSEG